MRARCCAPLLLLFRGGLLLWLLRGFLLRSCFLLGRRGFLLLRRCFFLGRFGLFDLGLRFLLRRGLLGLGGGLFGLFLDLRLEADELDDRGLRGVAAARADLDDAGVAA